MRIPSVPKDGNVGAFSDRMVNLIVFGDQGVGPHSTVTAASMGAAVLKGDVDAVLHVGDFGVRLLVERSGVVGIVAPDLCARVVLGRSTTCPTHSSGTGICGKTGTSTSSNARGTTGPA